MSSGAHVGPPEGSDRRHIALMVTGASAALQLPTLLGDLRARTDAWVSVLLSESARRFVTPQAICLLADELIDPAALDYNPVAVAHRADLVVVAPATANFVVAAGLGLPASPVLTVALATAAPVVVFPHTDDRLWRRSTTQSAVSALRVEGVQVVEPVEAMTYSLSARRVITSRCMPAPPRAATLIAQALDGRPTARPAKVAGVRDDEAAVGVPGDRSTADAALVAGRAR